MSPTAVKQALRVASLGLLILTPGFAQEDQAELRDEIEALKQGQQQIRQQLEEIKKLLQARPAAPTRPSEPNIKDVLFELGENPSRGAESAKLTLVEFTDYQ